MKWIAKKVLNVASRVVQPGHPVPEAEQWPEHIRKIEESAGNIVWVEDETAVKMEQEAIARQQESDRKHKLKLIAEAEIKKNIAVKSLADHDRKRTSLEDELKAAQRNVDKLTAAQAPLAQAEEKTPVQVAQVVPEAIPTIEIKPAIIAPAVEKINNKPAPDTMEPIELKTLAKELGIPNYWRMSKNKLLDAVKKTLAKSG